MEIFKSDNKKFQYFIDNTEKVIGNLSEKAKKEDIEAIKKLINNFKLKTEDFYRDNRKLNIGVVGQVKAGKSSFLNTLLFEGKEILPKASTPKTATLTKMEYSQNNIINIEYYSVEEWEVLEDNASVDLDDEVYTSAREIVEMVHKNGIDPYKYLDKGVEQIEYDTYDELVENLNDYVGENGIYTPIVKAVTLYINKEEFKGLSIVDTPGLNDPIASRTIRTKEFMEVCDVVFFLSQSGSFLDKSDWTLLSSQLPQKGVKKLVLIASKYDSGVRDVLRIADEDDIFGDSENEADTIPKACKIIKKKLRKRAASKVQEYIEDLKQRGGTQELIEVVKQCADPILVSALAYNMTNKSVEDFNSEEKNVYTALKQFSDDIDKELKLLGNFDEVNKIFESVVEEKEKILEEKAKSFVPNATAELKGLLEGYKEKASKRLKVLQENDEQQLLEQKITVQAQIGKIKTDVATIFGELSIKLETEKAKAIQEIREASKDYLEIKEHTGSVTKKDSYTTGHFFWKKTHYYTYEEHYSYCIAADAVDNLQKYYVDATNQIGKVFTEALELRDLKRKLHNVVVDNFDMGSEKYDSSLFKLMIKESISGIEFPVFNIDISKSMNGIVAKFSGELTSANQKTELSTALSHALIQIYDELCNSLSSKVKTYKKNLDDIEKKVQVSLLGDVNKEFDNLLVQCKDKQKEIARYKSYIAAIDNETSKL